MPRRDPLHPLPPFPPRPRRGALGPALSGRDRTGERGPSPPARDPPSPGEAGGLQDLGQGVPGRGEQGAAGSGMAEMRGDVEELLSTRMIERAKELSAATGQ